MKHAGGSFDYSYNAQAAVDETAYIIVAAELVNSAADSGQLAMILAAVRRDAGADPQQVVADAGYRSEAMFEQLRDHPSKLIVALGRDGKTMRPSIQRNDRYVPQWRKNSNYRRRGRPIENANGFRNLPMSG